MIGTDGPRTALKTRQGRADPIYHAGSNYHARIRQPADRLLVKCPHGTTPASDPLIATSSAGRCGATPYHAPRWPVPYEQEGPPWRYVTVSTPVLLSARDDHATYSTPVCVTETVTTS